MGLTYLGKVALIIQKKQHTERLLADEVKTGLVVSELHSLPTDALLPILLLFQLEDVLVEVKL